MTIFMPNSGTFRLKGRELLKLGNGVDNAHQLSLKSKVSWPTIHRVIEQPEKVQALSFDILASILLDGLGYTPEEAKSLTLGDLFEYIPEEARVSK